MEQISSNKNFKILKENKEKIESIQSKIYILINKK
jgi:hypothetical protein